MTKQFTQGTTVFVSGAGFTRAFAEDAPLLVDDYGLESIAQRFREWPYALGLLESAIQPDGRSDMEQLLTRLDDLLPYDIEQGKATELALLREALWSRFLGAIVGRARGGKLLGAPLAFLAAYCVERGVHCITLNYDDIFDQALWEYRRLMLVDPTIPRYWHPDGGYGFFCKPSFSLVRESTLGGLKMDATAMLLLKLHGSVNWLIRRGYSRPLVIDALVHHEGWLDYSDDDGDDEQASAEAVLDHVEPEPFMVPPLLSKGNLIHQPVLRLVWHRAFKALAAADRVVFLGYSMPRTDIATQYLFREAIRSTTVVEVINWTRDNSPNPGLVADYKQVFPHLSDDDFDFRGVVAWTLDLAARAFLSIGAPVA